MFTPFLCSYRQSCNVENIIMFYDYLVHYLWEFVQPFSEFVLQPLPFYEQKIDFLVSPAPLLPFYKFQSFSAKLIEINLYLEYVWLFSEFIFQTSFIHYFLHLYYYKFMDFKIINCILHRGIGRGGVEGFKPSHWK